MLKFQQQIKKDLDAVFFNVPRREFVTQHKIAGTRGAASLPAQEYNVTVDRDLYIERQIRDGVEQVSLDGLVFFIRESEWIEKFERIPKIGSELRVDGERYLVVAVCENMGVLEFTLDAKRG